MKTQTENTYLNIPDLYVWGLNVKIYFTVERSGLGWYEFWGFKYFDRGRDYPNIIKIEPEFTNETTEEREEILKYIEDHFEDCAEQVAEKIILNKEL